VGEGRAERPSPEIRKKKGGELEIEGEGAKGPADLISEGERCRRLNQGSQKRKEVKASDAD